MPTPDERRSPRRVWPWVAVLVTLALVVPLGLLLRDDGATLTDGSHRLTSAEPSEPGASTPSTATPTQTPTTSSSPTPTTSEPATPPKPGVIRALYFGDSYFIGGAYTTAANSMARLSSNRLGWRSVIRGAGGTSFVQANPEYDLPNYLGQIADGAFDVGRRDWVVIEGGNDDRFNDQAQVAKNARKVLRIAQRRFPRAQVVLVGPLDTDGDYSDTTPVAKTLRKAARKRDVPFIDARKWLAGHFDLIGPDYTHPYPKGHRICATKLTRALRALGA